ncbi:cation transporter [halophilic archaeon]|nr:cation transporter [halophilic archaeon]
MAGDRDDEVTRDAVRGRRADERDARDGAGRAPDSGLRELALALGINTVFFVVELVGALYADSLALFADAVHMLADSASLALALVAAWVARRPADARRTYGYQRAEVLGAFANGVLLVAAVGYVLFDAVRRFQDPRPVDAPVVAVVGLVGLVANLAAAWVLADRRDVLNVEGAFLHLIADAAGSVAAVVVGVALVYTDLYVLDPVAALLVAALVLYSVRDLLSDSLNILLQGAPGDVPVDEVRRYIEGIEGVTDAHDVHVWALGSTQYTLSAHVVVAEGVDSDAVLRRCQSDLADRFGIDHATLQVESPSYAHTVDFDCYADER